jgi:hypothetical protein
MKLIYVFVTKIVYRIVSSFNVNQQNVEQITVKMMVDVCKIISTVRGTLLAFVVDARMDCSAS